MLKLETLKPLEENEGGALYNIGVRKDYLTRTPFVQELCLAVDQGGPLKTKISAQRNYK